MIEGIIIMIIGALLVAVTPAATHLAHHRHQRHLAPMTAVLEAAHPVQPVPADLKELVQKADAALERDALTRGIQA